MFADDDAYVNVPSLWSELANNGTINGSSYEVEKCFKFNKNGLDKFLLAQIWGRKFSGNVARPPEGFAQKYLEKSICPRYMFNGEAYPPYLSGAGLFCILQNPHVLLILCFLKFPPPPLHVVLPVLWVPPPAVLAPGGCLIDWLRCGEVRGAEDKHGRGPPAGIQGEGGRGIHFGKLSETAYKIECTRERRKCWLSCFNFKEGGWHNKIDCGVWSMIMPVFNNYLQVLLMRPEDILAHRHTRAVEVRQRNKFSFKIKFKFDLISRQSRAWCT